MKQVVPVGTPTRLHPLMVEPRRVDKIYLSSPEGSTKEKEK